MFTVIDPGFLSTVQDLGRTGFRAFGMPVSGAMDRYAFQMANILAGNPRDAAALEMTLRGGRFRFLRAAYVAICGAEMDAELNGTRISNWSRFYVPAESELVFGHVQSGCRSYLALRGGIEVPQVMRSCSTYLRARLGGHEGRALRAGDALRIGARGRLPAEPVGLVSEFVPHYAQPVCLRVMLGPQDDLFTSEGLHTFLHTEYTVSKRNDRMGYVLEGAAIAHTGGADIISDALCPGAVQVPGDGLPIIMAADCQTTGGYAKIAAVIGSDLAMLAQLKTGDKLSFAECNDEEARAALIAERDYYERAEACL